MNFIPKGDRLFIRPDEKQDNFSGIQVLGSDIKEEPRGVVMAAGTGVALHNISLNITGDMSEVGLLRMESIVRLIKDGKELLYKVGDHVIYGRYAGTPVTIDGVQGLIMREQDCFGTVEEASDGQADY